jgi:lambda repressor-like predicted transcriptional regulator
MLKGPDKIVARIHATRGLSAKIARACGTHRSAVYQWKQVPAPRVQLVAEIMGLSPEEIRPDIFKPRKRQAKADERTR